MYKYNIKNYVNVLLSLSHTHTQYVLPFCTHPSSCDDRR